MSSSYAHPDAVATWRPTVSSWTSSITSLVVVMRAVKYNPLQVIIHIMNI